MTKIVVNRFNMTLSLLDIVLLISYLFMFVVVSVLLLFHFAVSCFVLLPLLPNTTIGKYLPSPMDCVRLLLFFLHLSLSLHMILKRMLNVFVFSLYNNIYFVSFHFISFCFYFIFYPLSSHWAQQTPFYHIHEYSTPWRCSTVGLTTLRHQVHMVGGREGTGGGTQA